LSITHKMSSKTATKLCCPPFQCTRANTYFWVTNLSRKLWGTPVSKLWLYTGNWTKVAWVLFHHTGTGTLVIPFH